MKVVQRYVKMRVNREAFLDILKEHNFTLAGAANAAQVSEKQIRRGLKNGQLSQDVIFSIAKVLNVVPDELTGKRRSNMYKKPIHKQVSVSEMEYMREEEGMSNVEIAKSLDIHPATVGKMLPKKARGNLAIVPDSEIIDLLKSGVTHVDIAKKYGVSVQGVGYRIAKMRKNGLDIPVSKFDPKRRKEQVPVDLVQRAAEINEELKKGSTVSLNEVTKDLGIEEDPSCHVGWTADPIKINIEYDSPVLKSGLRKMVTKYDGKNGVCFTIHYDTKDVTFSLPFNINNSGFDAAELSDFIRDLNECLFILRGLEKEDK